ncbi:MAG: DnaJ domain-containing protein [bacterium]|nr:DnaJ domain-containing protein [bacterium]
MKDNSLYQLLEVESHASFDEIKKSFRRLAHVYHPDAPTGHGNEELFTSLVDAYSTLSDPQKRASYDRSLALKQKIDELSGKKEQPKPKTRTSDRTQSERENNRPSSTRSTAKEAAPGLNSARFSGNWKQKGLLGKIRALFSTTPTAVDDIKPGLLERVGDMLKKQTDKQVTRTLTIDALESIIGTSREVSFPHDDEKVIVPIPPEIDNKRIIRIKHTGKNGKKHEMRARVNIIPHEYFERRGTNIIVKLPITLGESISGTSVRIPTPAGAVKLTIPPMENGKSKKLRIGGKGVKAPGSIVRGDVIVDPYIVLPERYPEALANAVKQIESLYDSDPRSELPDDLLG